MADSRNSIILSQVLGLTTSAFLSGSIITLSYATIPPLLQSPSALLVQQWATLYHRGKRAAIPLAITSAANFAYLTYKHAHAWGLPAAQRKWPLYAVASVITISIVPYTLLVMAAVNRRLFAKAREAIVLGDEMVDDAEAGVKQLVDTWAMLNLGRGLLPLLGSLTAAWAALS